MEINSAGVAPGRGMVITDVRQIRLDQVDRDLVALFDAERPPAHESVTSSYNVAPTNGVAAVAEHKAKDRDEPARRQLRVLKWGR
jgi:putative SOS response-associated peptidase YedK